MDTCYFCGRTAEEVKEYCLNSIKSSFAEKVNELKKKMETEAKIVDEKEKRLFEIKEKIGNDVLEKLNLTIGTINKEIGNIQIPFFDEYISIFRNFGIVKESLKLKEAEALVILEIEKSKKQSKTQNEIDKINNEMEKQLKAFSKVGLNKQKSCLYVGSGFEKKEVDIFINKCCICDIHTHKHNDFD